MISRKALLIGNPGEKGAENYCEGVFVDIKNYKRFLTSPQGGAWYNNEIDEIIRPTKQEVINKISELSVYDYTYVVFTGHGYIEESEYSQTIKLILKNNLEIDAKELKKFASKRTIALDCCREIYDKHGNKLFNERMDFTSVFKSDNQPQFNNADCRKYFDNQIEKCSNGIIVKHSCKPGQTSGDDDVLGGYYISCLLEEANKWALQKLNNKEQNKYYWLTTVKAHNLAKPKTEDKADQKGKIQSPYIEKPKEGNYFPFSIVA